MPFMSCDVQIDSERQGQLGYAGLSERDVFGRTPLMYAAVADSKPCLDMLLTCGAKREVVRLVERIFYFFFQKGGDVASCIWLSFHPSTA